MISNDPFFLLVWICLSYSIALIEEQKLVETELSLSYKQV